MALDGTLVSVKLTYVRDVISAVTEFMVHVAASLKLTYV
jgi:hypothetical protein